MLNKILKIFVGMALLGILMTSCASQPGKTPSSDVSTRNPNNSKDIPPLIPEGFNSEVLQDRLFQDILMTIEASIPREDLKTRTNFQWALHRYDDLIMAFLVRAHSELASSLSTSKSARNGLIASADRWLVDDLESYSKTRCTYRIFGELLNSQRGTELLKLSIGSAKVTDDLVKAGGYLRNTLVDYTVSHIRGRIARVQNERVTCP